MLRDPSYYIRARKMRDMYAKSAVLPTRPIRRSSSTVAITELEVKEASNSLRRIVEDYLEIDLQEDSPVYKILESPESYKYFEAIEYEAGAMVFEAGQQAKMIYFIESGVVEQIVYSGADSDPTVNRISKVSDGGVFGETDFLLNRTHQ